MLFHRPVFLWLIIIGSCFIFNSEKLFYSTNTITMKGVLIILLALFVLHPVYAQKKKPDAIIVSKYGDEFKVRLSRIVNDSLYFFATPYNSDSALKQFYLRTWYDEHGIDVSYLRSVTIRPGKVLANSTLGGAILGGAVFATLAYKISQSETDNVLKNLGQGALGLGGGILLGGGVGFVVGIFQRKKIKINGSASQLDKVQQYIL